MSNSVRPHGLQPTRFLRPWDSPGKNTGVSCHFLLQCMKVESESEVTQSCLTLSDPMDCSLPGSSIHGIFWATALEWGAIAFSLKIGHKAAKTAQNNNTFGPETANEHTVQKWFKNFCTGLRIFASGLRNFAQEFLHRWGAQWLAIRNWPWTIESNHQSWSSYNYTRICQRTQCWPSYSRLAFEANGKVKKFKWCFMNWSKLKNIVILEWCLLILCNNKESFLDWIVMCNKNRVLYNSWQRLVNGWIDKKHQSTSQSQTCTQKVIITVWWSAAGLIHYSFLNPSKIITSEKYAQEIWDALKTAVPTEGIGQQKGLDSSPWQCLTTLYTTNTSKVEWIWL